MLKTIAACVAVALVLGIEATAAPRLAPFAKASFAITLPTGATAAKQEGPDFDTYTVKWGLTGTLGIYEGCCPQTFLTDPAAAKTETTINDIPVRQSMLRDGEATSKELYFDVQPEPGGEGHAFTIHVWYTNLDEADAKTADQIFASIRRKTKPQ